MKQHPEKKIYYFWEDDKELKTAQDKGIISEVQIKTIETTKIEINNNILKLEKIKEKVILNLDWTV